MPPHAAAQPPPASVEEVVARFLDGTLEADQWTHPAHLFVCRHVLATAETTEAAIDRLRELIGAHNDRVGIRPGHGGYHETITRYFVGTMAFLAPPSVPALLLEPALGRHAPLRHWTRQALGTDAARIGWIDPDLADLAWIATSGQTA